MEIDVTKLFCVVWSWCFALFQISFIWCQIPALCKYCYRKVRSLITPLKKTCFCNEMLSILRHTRLWSPWRRGHGTCASVWSSLLAGWKLLTLLSSSGCLDLPSLLASSPLYYRALHARTTWDSHTQTQQHSMRLIHSHILNRVWVRSQDVEHMWWKLFSVLFYLHSHTN